MSNQFLTTSKVIELKTTDTNNKINNDNTHSLQSHYIAHAITFTSTRITK